MFDDPSLTAVNIILIVGAVFAFLMARWVGRLNKQQHAKNVAAKSIAH